MDHERSPDARELRLTVRPVTRDFANGVIARWHRHHRRVQGHRFALGAFPGGDEECVGVCVVGNPKARALNDGVTFEVVRLCTNGHPNAASFLLGAAWRTARAMGVKKFISYTRADEAGTCYRAAGWTDVANLKARTWDAHTDGRRSQIMLPDMFAPTSEAAPRVRWELSDLR